MNEYSDIKECFYIEKVKAIRADALKVLSENETIIRMIGEQILIKIKEMEPMREDVAAAEKATFELRLALYDYQKRIDELEFLKNH